MILAGAGASGAVYTATLDGLQENPAVVTPGSGTATVTHDPLAHTLAVDIDFQNLIGTTTAAHIHAPAAIGVNAGVATQTPFFVGFPIGVTSGSYFHVLDLTDPASFSGTFLANNGGTPASAEAALGLFLDGGLAYVNIHTTFRPGGEIRGQLSKVSTPVPEPGTYVAMAGLGLPIAWVLLRRRRAGRSPVPAC